MSHLASRKAHAPNGLPFPNARERSGGEQSCFNHELSNLKCWLGREGTQPAEAPPQATENSDKFGRHRTLCSIQVLHHQAVQMRSFAMSFSGVVKLFWSTEHDNTKRHEPT